MARWRSTEIPDSDMQALMESAPGEEPRSTKADMMEVQERLAQVEDECLNDRERWVINAVLYEKKPYRTVAAELGMSKTMVGKIYKQALREMRECLER